MGFFVVGRSSDGSLAMLGSEEYESREAAARGIQALAGAGSIDVSGRDVYIVDMAGAAPVVIVGMAAPADALPVELPAAGAWEAPPEVEPDAEIEPVPDVIVEAGVESDEFEQAAAALDEQATPDLADALKRAATSLEEEGIVAPESIGSPFEPVIDEDLSEVIASLSADTEEPQVAVPEAAEATVWPWANVEVVDPNEVAPVEESEGGEDVALPVEEPTLETPVEPIGAIEDEGSLIVASAAYGDDAFEPRPLIMGDYDSVSTPPAVEEAVSEPEPIEEPVVDEPVVVEEPPAEEPVVVDESALDEPLGPESAPGLEALPEVTAPAGGYEASGELELNSYSCEDCVYSNTCPKVGESSPDECGSFQWKAV